MDQLLGTHQTEQQLAEYFGNQRCIVVSGNSEEQTKVADAFGEALSEAQTDYFQKARISSL